MLKPSLSSGRDVAVADVAYDGGAYEVPAEARAGAWARLCTRVRVAPQRETNCLGYVLAARCGRSQTPQGPIGRVAPLSWCPT